MVVAAYSRCASTNRNGVRTRWKVGICSLENTSGTTASRVVCEGTAVVVSASSTTRRDPWHVSYHRLPPPLPPPAYSRFDPTTDRSSPPSRSRSQLTQIRNAFALAKKLNRVLILPRLVCGLDRWWAPHSGIM